MPRPLKIDFVSDVVCPWCIIGLRGLEEAVERTRDVVDVTVHFQPFELNPQMAPEGENIGEHIARKYGSTPEQSAANRQMIRDRAGALGFSMNSSADSRIYNTFDAHRLLHWAETEGADKQTALKHALFTAYFTDQQNPSDPEVLVAAAQKAGLDGEAAREVLALGRYAEEVRAAEQLWQSRGINSVPAIVIEDKWLISGGQPPEAFEQALRDIAGQLA
ncbi:putative DsbA family dithiol-disulfide isomerase [Sphingomonas kyeonggiensis]|uniref:Putative DsbA family dithiol-disulfide isomerase n=1 Tax=Sphingomonas kyeonggiensis TaxID=1268553 RepID=A0A7W7NTA5_9SPHN|nr:DsbA family oxidoreductase [Sphingomonas kyeonggiensis]MBB4839671.1 putative DsbA family dithiol-disulfide isomerase [Sphingomonas kyeonggiensis]